MTETHKFAYRVPRFFLQLRVEFWTEGASIVGISKDLSDSGMQVRLAVPVIPGSSGRIRLHLDDCTIELGAEVAHAEMLDAGLRFRFSSAAEEHFIRTLVKVISRGLGKFDP